MRRRAPQLFNGLFSGRLARFIVILFLSYAAVDIANPQLCSDEFLPPEVLLAANIEQRAEASAADVSVGAANDSNQDEHPSAPHSEDDCFCCCTHVLPGVTTHPIGTSDAVAQEVTLTPQSVSSVHLMAHYRPPRTV